MPDILCGITLNFARAQMIHDLLRVSIQIIAIST